MAESGGSPGVFISYASQDAEAAQRICDALREAGIEVWLDQTELRGGDAWDAGIRSQIKACALFIPLISQNASTRDEGYFRLEWKLAVDRSHLMAADRAFIVPVVIDSTRESEARVPERFTDVQWTRLPGGEATSEFATRIARLLQNESRGGKDRPPGRQYGVAASGARPRFPWVALAVCLIVLGVVAVVWIAMHPFGTSAPFGAAGIAATTPAPGSPTASSTGIPDKSIAVLPFVDMSEKKDQEYFADGMSEEILELLSKIPELHVPARTSSFYFKGKQATIADIAKALNVSHLLEGSVRKSGSTLRITVQLVRADNGFHLWSEAYDRKLDDVFKVQDEIANAVVRTLKVSLLGDAVRKPKGTGNIEAYNLYLQGRAVLMRTDSRADYGKSEEYFRRSLKLDPNFAPAMVWLSLSLASQAGVTLPAQKGFEEARREASRAQALDPNLSEAHTAMATVYFWYDWDWVGVEVESRKALALDNGNPWAWRYLGYLEEIRGHFKEALQSHERAVASDPLNPYVYNSLAYVHYLMGDFVIAQAASQESSDLGGSGWANPGSIVVLIKLAGGDPKGALAEADRLKDDDQRLFGEALANYALGRRAEADRALAGFEKNFAVQDAYGIASVHAYRGEIDQAFTWLDRAYRQRDSGLPFVGADLLLKNLHSDARFKEFLRKMKLSE